MWNLKRNDANEFMYKRETYSQALRTSLVGGRMVVGIVKEFEMDSYTWLYLKWIINKDLLYTTWNSAQCYMAVWMGGEFGREWIHLYV